MNVEVAEDGERSAETIKRLITAFQARDAATASSCFAEHGVFRERGRVPVEGRSRIREYFAAFFASGREWAMSIDHVLAGAATACVVYTFWIEARASGRSERETCSVVRFDADGLVVSWREYEG